MYIYIYIHTAVVGCKASNLDEAKNYFWLNIQHLPRWAWSGTKQRAFTLRWYTSCLLIIVLKNTKD